MIYEAKQLVQTLMKEGGPPTLIPSTSGTGRFCLALEERLVACDHKELGRQKDAPWHSQGERLCQYLTSFKTREGFDLVILT